MPVKTCNTCHLEKDIDEFNIGPALYGRRYDCRICQKAHHKIYWQKKRDKNPIIIPDLPGEIWVPLEKYEGEYMISNCKRIKSLARFGFQDRIIKTFKGKVGYLIFVVSKNDKSKTLFLHRAYATAFLPNPLNLPVINHKDGNKENNDLNNLEWCDSKHNMRHARMTGLNKAIGETHGQAILTNTEVLAIFNSPLLIRELSKQYQVHKITISQIKTGKNWSHLTGKTYTPHPRLTADEILAVFDYKGTIKSASERFNIGTSFVKNIRYGKVHSDITGKYYSKPT